MCSVLQFYNTFISPWILHKRLQKLLRSVLINPSILKLSRSDDHNKKATNLNTLISEPISTAIPPTHTHTHTHTQPSSPHKVLKTVPPSNILKAFWL